MVCRLQELFKRDEARLAQADLGRSGLSVRQVFQALCQRPLASIGALKEQTESASPRLPRPWITWWRLALPARRPEDAGTGCLPMMPTWPSSVRTVSPSDECQVGKSGVKSEGYQGLKCWVLHFTSSVGAVEIKDWALTDRQRGPGVFPGPLCFSSRVLENPGEVPFPLAMAGGVPPNLWSLPNRVFSEFTAYRL